MRIDPAGWPFLTGPLAPAAALAAIGRATGRRWPRRAARAGGLFPPGPVARPGGRAGIGGAPGGRGPGRAAGRLLGLAAYMALFFRAPARACDRLLPPADDVLAPADGVVMVAGEPQEG